MVDKCGNASWRPSPCAPEADGAVEEALHGLTAQEASGLVLLPLGIPDCLMTMQPSPQAASSWHFPARAGCLQGLQLQ